MAEIARNYLELEAENARLTRELDEAREDSKRMEFVMEHRAELWNRQLKDRAGIDAARKEQANG